jgi:hypothetical protein
MPLDFASLKKTRKNSLDQLSREVEKLNQTNGNSNNDDRFWKPEVDKAGNGYAVIRFLPAPKGEDVPFVRTFHHGFQGPGGWYIEESLTTIGKEDPVGKMNSSLWNSGIEANKEIARKQKRKLTFISNIYVVSDPANPSNEGKIFLYKYGKKIMDKINEAIHPEFEDETSINPFCFWEGANFKLKIRNYEGYRNYDKSEFADQEPLLGGDDDELEKIWSQEHSLQSFIDPKNFKTYEELERRLNMVLGNTGKSAAASIPSEEASVGKQQKAVYDTDDSGNDSDDDLPWNTDDDDGDDDAEMAEFRKLLNS